MSPGIQCDHARTIITFISSNRVCLLHFFFNSVAAHCCCLSVPFHNQPTCRAANRLTHMLHGQESQSRGTIHFFVSVPLRPSRNALTFFFFAVRRQLLSQIPVQVHIYWIVQSVITGVNKIITPAEEYYNQCQNNNNSCVQVIRISASGLVFGKFNTLRGSLSVQIKASASVDRVSIGKW